jgi:hypothetical protein
MQKDLVHEEYGQSTAHNSIIGDFFMCKNDTTIAIEKKIGIILFQNIRNCQDEQELKTIVNQKISNLIKKDLSKGVAIC